MIRDVQLTMDLYIYNAFTNYIEKKVWLNNRQPVVQTLLFKNFVTETTGVDNLL